MPQVARVGPGHEHHGEAVSGVEGGQVAQGLAGEAAQRALAEGVEPGLIHLPGHLADLDAGHELRGRQAEARRGKRQLGEGPLPEAKEVEA